MATKIQRARYGQSHDRVQRRLKIGAALGAALGPPFMTRAEVGAAIGGSKQQIAYEENMALYKILVRVQDIIKQENLEGLKMLFDI